MSGLLLSAGSLSDRYGRRGWLSGGLAAFAVTSAVAAQVNTADGLIAARAAMGVGAAVIFPTTLASDHEHLHRPGEAGQGHRTLGRDGRCRRRRRPDDRWLAARALLVGLDLPGQCAGRGRGDHRRLAVRADIARSRRATASTCPGLILSSVGVTAVGLHRHRGAKLGMEQRAHRNRLRRRRRRHHRVRAVGAAYARIRCSTCRCSPTGGSPAAASP